MADTEVGLVWKLSAQGTQAVRNAIKVVGDEVKVVASLREREARALGGHNQRAVSSIQELAARTRGVRQELPRVATASRAAENALMRAGVTGSSAFSGLKQQARSLWSTLSGFAGMAGLGVGLFGFEAVRRDAIALSDVIRGIQTGTGKTDAEAAKLSARFRGMALDVGKPAAEIADLADTIGDISGMFDRAATAAPKLELLAGAFNVKDVGAMGEAFAGIEKITGGKLSVDKQLAMLKEMAALTPMKEEDWAAATAKAAGPLATSGGLQGEGGVRALGGIVAVLGKTYSQQPRKIQGGIDQLLDVFQKQLTDSELATTLLRLGVDTKDAGTMFESFLGVLKKTPNALADVEGIPDELKQILGGAVVNLETFKKATAGITGDVPGLLRTLADRMKDPAVAFGRATEALKQALTPLVARLASWIAGNQGKIAALANFFGRLGGWAASQGDLVLSFLAAMAMRSAAAKLGLGMGGAGAVPGLPGMGGASGAGGGWVMGPGGAPVLLPGPGGGGGYQRTPLPPRMGSPAYDDWKARQAAGGAPGWGTTVGGAALGLGGAALQFLGPMLALRNAWGALSGEESPIATMLKGKMSRRDAMSVSGQGAGFAQGGMGALMGATAERIQNAITIQQTFNISADGVLTDTTTRQDQRQQPATVDTDVMFAGV
jgi:hypothetical protein